MSDRGKDRDSAESDRVAFLRTAQASGERWGSTVKAVVTALGPLPACVNFGLAYVTQPLAEDFPSIITFLRETTPIKHWCVAVVTGLLGPLGTVQTRPALAVLVAAMPPDSFRLVESWQEPKRSRFLKQQHNWLFDQEMPVALMHGDSFDPQLGLQIEDMAVRCRCFVIGGLAAQQPGQVSGVMFGSALAIVTGLTQGCSPLGAPLRVTEARETILLGLDGRPALDVMRDQLDPAMAKDLRRAAGVIHIGLPVAGSDRSDYLVRPLVGIDPARGWLAVGGHLAVGERVIFVKRDGEAARRDMQRMLTDIAQRTRQRSIKGGIYISCVARGEAMFGSDDAEAAMIRASLGEFPMIGMITQGEFCHDRLYGFTGVLALFLS